MRCTLTTPSLLYGDDVTQQPTPGKYRGIYINIAYNLYNQRFLDDLAGGNSALRRSARPELGVDSSVVCCNSAEPELIISVNTSYKYEGVGREVRCRQCTPHIKKIYFRIISNSFFLISSCTLDTPSPPTIGKYFRVEDIFYIYIYKYLFITITDL